MPKPADKGPKKKPYSAPQVTVHGTVRELTKRIGNAGNLDGGHIAGHTKTHA